MILNLLYLTYSQQNNLNTIEPTGIFYYVLINKEIIFLELLINKLKIYMHKIFDIIFLKNKHLQISYKIIYIKNLKKKN